MLKYLISSKYMPHPTVPHNVTHKSTMLRTAAAFWKNTSFTEHVLWEMSDACVDSKLRGIEATSIISGNRERPCNLKYTLWPVNLVEDTV